MECVVDLDRGRSVGTAPKWWLSDVIDTGVFVDTLQ